MSGMVRKPAIRPEPLPKITNFSPSRIDACFTTKKPLNFNLINKPKKASANSGSQLFQIIRRGTCVDVLNVQVPRNGASTSKAGAMRDHAVRCDLLHAPGVVPVAREKIFVRWLRSKKPQATATSAKGILVSASRSRA